MQAFFIFIFAFPFRERKNWIYILFLLLCHRMFDALKKNADIYVSMEETNQVMTWCDDCGNYAIQKALFQALTLQ